MQGLVDAQPGEAAASQLTDLRVDSISHESLKKKKNHPAVVSRTGGL